MSSGRALERYIQTADLERERLIAVIAAIKHGPKNSVISERLEAATARLAFLDRQLGKKDDVS